MTYTQPLVQRLASLVDARANCLRTPGKYGDWAVKHQDTADDLAKEHLPSGSGFDSGTTIDWDKSTGERLVLNTSFHHMDESGMYDGWTDHSVIVKASLVHGYTVRVTGKDRRDIKDYIASAFREVLDIPVPL